MIELTKVERENKVYVNDEVVVIDKDNIKASELLELAGFSSLVYDIYLAKTEQRKKNTKKENKKIEENKKIKLKTGMCFDAILKQS